MVVLLSSEGCLTLDTDVWDKQTRCVLIQDQEYGAKKPLRYWSQTLYTAEYNYDKTRGKCLALVWAILVQRPYLDRKRFTVRTDYVSLKWIFNLADLTGRLARWRLLLSEIYLDVVHRAGINPQATDGLLPLETETEGTYKTLSDDDISELVVLLVQQTDPTPMNRTAGQPTNILHVIIAASLTVSCKTL